ncbi:DNA-binding protein [bacterium]|nr:MAG: DNA-binding protein [bacterium]
MAQMLQIAPSTLRRWAHKGQIHGHTLNAEAWSSVLDFDAFLDIPACPPPTYFRVSEILAQVSR